MDGFAGELVQRLARTHLLKHPFYQAWSAGELTKEQLAVYARQYYHQVEAFPRYVSGVHAGCTDLETRRKLLENLIAEERGENNHPELWMRFAESLGQTREAVKAQELLPETAEMIETFSELTRSGTYAEGLGALFAYEQQVPAVAQSKIDGLKKFYGLDNERALSFFTEHLEADVWHSQEEAEMMNALSPKEQLEAGAAAERAGEALWKFLDGICRETGAGQKYMAMAC